MKGDSFSLPFFFFVVFLSFCFCVRLSAAHHALTSTQHNGPNTRTHKRRLLLCIHHAATAAAVASSRRSWSFLLRLVLFFWLWTNLFELVGLDSTGAFPIVCDCLVVAKGERRRKCNKSQEARKSVVAADGHRETDSTSTNRSAWCSWQLHKKQKKGHWNWSKGKKESSRAINSLLLFLFPPHKSVRIYRLIRVGASQLHDLELESLSADYNWSAVCGKNYQQQQEQQD